MITSKRSILMIIYFISCSIQMLAQSDFYYYEGKKIPLRVNDKKVCVSIPKVNDKTSKFFLENVNVQKQASIDKYDTYSIAKSELDQLSSLKAWKEDRKNVKISNCYISKNNEEILVSPYIYVRLKKEQDIDILLSQAKKYGLKIEKNDPFMPLWYTLAVTENCDKNALEYANILWESRQFEASTPGFYYEFKPTTIPNDPLFNQQWGLKNFPEFTNAGHRAWEYSTGKGVTIGIFDTGVNFNCNSDLRYKWAGKYHYLNPSYDSYGPSGWTDEEGHGTMVAGIAAASWNDNSGIAGVAPDAGIIPITWCPNMSNTSSEIADAFVWAAQNGVDIISCSWCLFDIPSELINEGIRTALNTGRNGKGCIIVFSSGNDGESPAINHITYPANVDERILVVGSVDSLGRRAHNSIYGQELDLVAPGVSVLTISPDGTYKRAKGTSCACPYVSGVAALILAINGELTVYEVHDIICSSASKHLRDHSVHFTNNTYGLWNEQYGYGYVNAYQAVMNTPNIYIQNKTVTTLGYTKRKIAGDSIFIGKNVTDMKPYGNVLLGQGDTIVMEADYIHIKNSTVIPSGTVIDIHNRW